MGGHSRPRMRYFLWIDDKKQGPYDEEHIRGLLDRRAVPPTTLALAEDGTGDWAPTHLPSLIGPAKAESPVAKPYYILDAEETRGPFTIGQLRSMWSTGSITTKTMHCQEGDEQWRPLSSILHLIEPPPTVAPASVAISQPSVLVVRATKSRGVYIILGLFFGCLGIHNFYAGHYGRGAAQLIITLLLGWLIIGLVITVLWSLIEIIAETHDGDGQRMT